MYRERCRHFNVMDVGRGPAGIAVTVYSVCVCVQGVMSSLQRAGPDGRGARVLSVCVCVCTGRDAVTSTCWT